ncbi:hypothetical protein AB4039_03825 [Streptomyces sp. M-16]|uniref:hypothetical protein n=1 Tax=Streptomyces sp. M-16 TaxID=3233040 RepID=UPI00224D172A
MPAPSPYRHHTTTSARPANSPGGEGRSGTPVTGSRSAGYLAAGDYWFSCTTGIVREVAASRSHTWPMPTPEKSVERARSVGQAGRL